MTKENNHGPYEFLGNMVVSLMNVDPSVSISFLETEIHVSRRDVCAMRQGKDLHLYQYVRVMNCIMDEIHLEILLNVLLKELKTVLTAHCDLVIGTVSSPALWKQSAGRVDGGNEMGRGKRLIGLSYPECYLSFRK